MSRRRGQPPRAVRPASARKSANDPGARPETDQPFRTSPAPGIQPSRRDGREGWKSMNGAVRLRVTEKAGDRPRSLHVRNPALRQPGRNRRTFPNAWRRRPALEAAWPPALRPGHLPAAWGSSMAAPGMRDPAPETARSVRLNPPASRRFRAARLPAVQVRGGKSLASAARPVLCCHRPARPVNAERRPAGGPPGPPWPVYLHVDLHSITFGGFGPRLSGSGAFAFRDDR